MALLTPVTVTGHRLQVLEQPLVFLDLETTGASAARDRITEIGMIEVTAGDATTEWSTLVNPGIPIPAGIQAVTGITDDMVAAAPSFRDIARSVLARIEGKLLVAHHARFDYGFLRNEFQRAGLSYSSQVLCTVKLSRRLFPHQARHNLDALLARYGIWCDARHRALGDARAIRELVLRWHRDIEPARLAAVANDLTATPHIPASLPEGTFDGIPEAPGVYRFYGEDDEVLYVGRGPNLRSRVSAHFSAHRDAPRDLQLARKLRRVEWTETGGTLAAQLEEARLIRSLAPVHNRRPRRLAEPCAWRWRVAEPASAPQLVTAHDLEYDDLGDLYGLFRTRSAARGALREIAAAHGLCPILLGLERGNGPCRARQARRCRGACSGEESVTTHGLRLAAALARLQVRPWPFRGRVGVRERGNALIVLDRWCYLGTARSEAELAELSEIRTQRTFDPDIYRILSRFFASARRNYRVVDLAA